MKKISLITFLAIVFSQFIFSQFKEGYIINNNNDTINGYIIWEGSINNSSQCEFKLTPDSETQLYKPGEIIAFRFNNSKFFSTWDLLIDDQTKKVFIEWLIKGRASLLTYTGAPPDIKFYLLTETRELLELTNTTQEILQDKVVYERKKKEYIGTLMSSFQDCPALHTKISATPFNSKSLIKITKEYHELTCKTEDCLVFEEKNRKLILDWGVYTAFQNSNWLLNNVLPENVYPSNSFGLGFALNISNLPALSPKFSAKVNLAIFSSMYRYDTANAWSLIGDDRILKIVYAKIPVQLSYRFSQTKFSPYLSAGGTINVRFSYKQYDQYLTNWITRSLRSNSYTSKVSPLQFGLNTGCGFEYIKSPTLRFNIGYDFEYCPRLYGTYADDHSRVLNNVIYLRAYFF